MENSNAWWTSLTLAAKIYWGLAVPFTILFVLQMLFSFFGGGEHPDDTPDADVESDHGIPFQFITFKNMVGFFTIFSWTGIVCLDAGFSNGLSILIATFAGLAMMSLMAGIYYGISRAGADGTMKFSKAIGQEGEVYLTIPSMRKGAGKVQIMIMGSFRTLDAMTDADHDIPTGKMVSVSAIINDSILLVNEK